MRSSPSHTLVRNSLTGRSKTHFSKTMICLNWRYLVSSKRVPRVKPWCTGLVSWPIRTDGCPLVMVSSSNRSRRPSVSSSRSTRASPFRPLCQMAGNGHGPSQQPTNLQTASLRSLVASVTRAMILRRQELAKKWETIRKKLTYRLKTGKLI